MVIDVRKYLMSLKFLRRSLFILSPLRSTIKSNKSGFSGWTVMLLYGRLKAGSQQTICPGAEGLAIAVP
jgi:hypothetical protein